mmetsp:Transcript_15534/g.28846  ORF Transcript_15534/g.28846 Transcript_15534/m.28846 type:complete len:609 (+) Transcript_15534:156-1982(+)
MAQQSELMMQTKDEQSFDQKVPKHARKQRGSDEGKDQCTYSRDQMLRIFVATKDHSAKSAKASNTSTASSPTTAPSAAPSDSKGSSLMDTPDLVLPPTLFSKDSSSDSNNGNNKDSSSDSNKSQKSRRDSPVRVEPESKDSSSDTSNGHDQASPDQNEPSWLEETNWDDPQKVWCKDELWETWDDPQKVWCKQASWDDLYGLENGAFGTGLLGSSALADCSFEDSPFGSSMLGDSAGMMPMLPFMPNTFPFSSPDAIRNLQASLSNLQKLAKHAKGKPAKSTADDFNRASHEVCDCGNVLNPAFLFCDQCGKKRQQAQACECGNILVKGANFCDQCGKKHTNAEVVANTDTKGNTKEKAKVAAKEKTKAGSKQNQKIVAKADANLDVTTLMLRNIPKCTQDQLFEHLEQIGFKGMIDFLYLPVDFSNERNFGYAFANFRTTEAANNFKEMFDGVEMGKCFPEDFGSEDKVEPAESESDSSSPSNTERVRQRKAKRSSNRNEVCKVLPAAVQGWEANMQRLCNSHSVQRIGGPDHWHPMFLDAVGQKINVADRYKSVSPSKTPLNPQAVEFVPGGKSFNPEETLFSQSDLDAHPSTRGCLDSDSAKAGA